MGGKIDCYIDIASYYSYVAFYDLLAKREALATHGVTVEFHPVLIAGVISASGNQPPWKLPLKATYYTSDVARTATRVGLAHHSPDHPRPVSSGPSAIAPANVKIAFPRDNFLALSNTVVALRALLYIKTRMRRERAFELVFAELFARFFTVGVHEAVGRAEVLERILGEVYVGEGEGERFTREEVKEIMAATQGDEMRALLREQTAMVTRTMGAFGLPWWWVTRFAGAEGEGEEKSEPFWGSDRFVEVCRFLGVPCRDVEVVLPGGDKARL